jgi:hypothetical protein
MASGERGGSQGFVRGFKRLVLERSPSWRARTQDEETYILYRAKGK